MNTTTTTTPANIKVKATKAKKVASVAAVLPIVSSSTKEVFLKIAKANGDRSKEATIKALEMKKYDNFDAELTAFAKKNADAHVWNSRVAKVQPVRVEKSKQNQIAFWTKQGYTVVNATAA